MVDKKYPKRYIPKGLSEADKKKQKKQLDKSTSDYKKGKFTERKKLESFKSKPSGYVEKVKKKLNITSATTTNIANKLGKTDKRKKEIKKGLEEIKDKGEGAFFSSGSRPNQSPQSWGIGRYSSVLIGGASRKIDKKIVDKYNIPKI
jgi:CRISPR/Cas system CSM-associated protein Csm4 (group 5 of RAMP superfamily)